MSAGLAQCGATATTAAAPWLEQQRAQVAWQLVFDSGYLTQADAYYCMQASRMLGVCARAARNLWQCIDLSCDQAEDMFDNWSEAMLNSITAKRPKELILNMCATREHVSAILGRSAQLRRLTFNSARMECMRALDSLQVPLVALALECEDDQLDEEFLAELVAAAPQLTQLTELRLGCNTVGDACAHLIATQFAQLRTLSFADCGEGAVFTEMVASSPMLKLLKELRLYDICIDDATMQLIAAEFTQLNVLQMTDSRDKLTSAGVRHLCADGAHTRTTLRELNLDCCYHIENDIAEDVLAMPNLEALSVKYVRMCTDEWAEDLRRRYEERHNRHIDVLTAVESYGELDSDLDEWDEWPDYDDDGEYDYDVSQDEGDDY